MGVNSDIELTHETMLNETVFTASRDDVWKALLAAHEQMAVPVQQMRTAENAVVYFAPNLARTFMGKPLSRYFDCGNGPGGQPRANTYRVSLKITEALDSVAPGQVRLRTEAQANARSQDVSSDALYCNTTMQLEKLIATMVAARLKS